MEALTQEFVLRAEKESFLTAFIGGGTPTTLTGNAWNDFLTLVSRMQILPQSAWESQNIFGLEIPQGPPSGVEITCEANPGTIDFVKLKELRSAGVNRISIGAQTFDLQGLSILGRSHSAQDITDAYYSARQAGFSQINLDLLHGWPGQTIASWREDLQKIIALSPDHISCYALNLMEGTPLANAVTIGRCDSQSEETLRQGWDLAGELLESNGYERYEISNFAKKNFRARHNAQYWTGGDYIGLGTAAHSHIDGRRFANTEDSEQYERLILSKGDATDFSEYLPHEKKARETLVTWLRMRDGVPANGFYERTNVQWQTLIANVLPRLIASGGLEMVDENTDNPSMRLTREAFPVADCILSELV